MKTTKAIVLKDKKGNWFWRIKAPNGRILSHSESYGNLSKAKKGLASMIKAVIFNKIVVVVEE